MIEASLEIGKAYQDYHTKLYYKTFHEPFILTDDMMSENGSAYLVC
jgi:hypothetical protein